MIYIKRTLWLLGYPIMWILTSIILFVTFTLFLFECLFLYIKNGDIQGCDDCFELYIKLADWYNDIEPKERNDESKN